MPWNKHRYLFVPHAESARYFIVTARNELAASVFVATELSTSASIIKMSYRVVPMVNVTELNVGGSSESLEERTPVVDVPCNCLISDKHSISIHGTSPEWDEKHYWVPADSVPKVVVGGIIDRPCYEEVHDNTKEVYVQNDMCKCGQRNAHAHCEHGGITLYG